MSVATVTALAAKEVAVGTLATLNAVEAGDDEPSESLVEKVEKNNRHKSRIGIYRHCNDLFSMPCGYGDVFRRGQRG